VTCACANAGVLQDQVPRPRAPRATCAVSAGRARCSEISAPYRQRSG